MTNVRVSCFHISLQNIIIPHAKKKISDICEKYVDSKDFFLFIYAPLLYYSANLEMFIPDCCFLKSGERGKDVILYETYK